MRMESPLNQRLRWSPPDVVYTPIDVTSHVLGILPTGTGKSVCYQISALSRYDKTGAMTVVISPLVALMTD